MDRDTQAAGEAKVRAHLIAPLERRGLAKPASLTRAQYGEMVADLCQRLAYMSEASLAALEEQVAGNPAGRERDRLPIANKILDWAGQIQPPGEEASPLMRAVFGGRLGAEALAEGWAPELLADLRQNRRWPGAWAVSQLRERGQAAGRQLQLIEEARAAGRGLPEGGEDWRRRRMAAVEKCRAIAALAEGAGAVK